MLVTIQHHTTNTITSYHDGNDNKKDNFCFELFATDGIRVVVLLDKVELSQLQMQLENL